jgi:pseudoazurin|tara:strand:- start:95 stop:538 length:444 start_codon:yes stop_codon:yes gene_type:complete
MKFLNTILAGSLVILSGAALAESHEVQMLNTGSDGVMVFEPAVLSINPGDSVTFKATNPGHNSESMQGMMPEGAEGWQGGMGQDVTVTFDQDGVYVYQCTPHLMMAMVGVIKVGSGSNLEAIKAVAIDKKAAFMMAQDRLDGYLNQL